MGRKSNKFKSLSLRNSKCGFKKRKESTDQIYPLRTNQRNKMDTNCACDENIFIKEEWLEDVVYKRTDEVGGFQHVHINQALIRAVTALDHDYVVCKVKVKDEPQDFQTHDDDSFIKKLYWDKRICAEGKNGGNLLAEDHSSEGTLTAEETPDEDEDSWIGVTHTSGQRDLSKIIKTEPLDQTDVHEDNSSGDLDGNHRVGGTVIKQECVECVDDTIDEFNTNTRVGEENYGHSMLPEDQWSNDTLTATEGVEEIDDGWNSDTALSPGAFIEEVDADFASAPHDLDDNCNGHDKVIKKDNHIDKHSDDGTRTMYDRLCSNNGIVDEAGNDDPSAMFTGDNHNDMPLSPGEFIEEVYGDCDNIAHDSENKLSVHSAVNKNEQHDDESTKHGLMLDDVCTIEVKNGNPSTAAFDECSGRVLSAEKHSARTNRISDDAGEDWIYSVPEDYVDLEEYDFPLDEAIGKHSADSDESWTPRKKSKSKLKRRRKIYPYVCRSCGHKCDTQSLLESHVDSSKSCDDPYGCNFCDERCLDIFALKEHNMKKHSESKHSRKKAPYVCRSCGYECYNQSLLKSHVKSSKTCEKPYGCNLCDKRYLDRVSLKEHVEKHSKSTKSNDKICKDLYVCRSCGYECDEKSQLIRHVKSSETCESPFVCNLCDKGYFKRVSLKVHIMSKHPESTMYRNIRVPYVCRSCGYECYNQSLLKLHAKSSETCERPFGCNLCDKKYLKRVSLKVHMMKHSESTLGRNKTPYVCRSCGYDCDEKSQLIRHVKSSETCESPFVCNICDKRYFKRFSLKVHMMKHSESTLDRNIRGLYVCRSCGYECYNQSLLKSHVKSSESCEKPYRCNLCDKKYSSGCSLKKHLKKHSRKKPSRKTPFGKKYKCDICSYRAPNFGSLKKHKFVHTGEKPYSCSVCNHEFRQVSHLNAHMRRLHGSQLKPSL